MNGNREIPDPSWWAEDFIIESDRIARFRPQETAYATRVEGEDIVVAENLECLPCDLLTLGGKSTSC